MIQNIHQFWDQFGVFAFLWLTIDATYDIYQDKEKDWRTWLRLGIGITGLIVDTYLVRL